jgi:predicted RNA-binding Zn ribbon-like protein
VKFGFVCGRACLNFAGTLKHRSTSRDERLTDPGVLSTWAVQAGLVDADIEVSPDDLVTAIEVREAIYRTVTARLDGRTPHATMRRSPG